MNKSEAQLNLEKLPAECYAVLLVNDNLIKIRAGERGYYRLPQDFPKRECALKNLTMDQLAEAWNTEMGVTPEQREAMEIGSIFGWEVPGANPDIYNKQEEMPF